MVPQARNVESRAADRPGDVRIPHPTEAIRMQRPLGIPGRSSRRAQLQSRRPSASRQQQTGGRIMGGQTNETRFPILLRGGPVHDQQNQKPYGVLAAELDAALAREARYLREKNELSERQVMLAQEFEHRLVNGMQLIVSLLSLQSRSAKTPEATDQLMIAARRVGSLARVHRRLHLLDHQDHVEFRAISRTCARTCRGCCSRRAAATPSAWRGPTSKSLPRLRSRSASSSTSWSPIRRNTPRATLPFGLEPHRRPIVTCRSSTMGRDCRPGSTQRKAKASE